MKRMATLFDLREKCRWLVEDSDWEIPYECLSLLSDTLNVIKNRTDELTVDEAGGLLASALEASNAIRAAREAEATAKEHLDNIVDKIDQHCGRITEEFDRQAHFAETSMEDDRNFSSSFRSR
jgi:hypothetical protein